MIEKKLIFFNSEGNTINAKWSDQSQSWQADLILPENSSDTYKTFPIYTFEKVDSFDFISERAVLEKWQLFNERGINYNGSSFFSQSIKRIEPVNRDRNLYSKWIIGDFYESKFPKGSYIKFPEPIFEFQDPNKIYQVVDSKKDAILIISDTDNNTFTSVWGLSSSFTQSYSNKVVSGVNCISVLDYRNENGQTNLSVWSEPDFYKKLFFQRKLTVINSSSNDGVFSVSNKNLKDSEFNYYYFWEDSVDKDDNIIAVLTLLTRLPIAHEGEVRLEGKNIFFSSPASDLLYPGVKFYIPQSIFNTQILQIDDISDFNNISTNTRYNQGDLITYNRKVYQCIESYTHSINSPVYPFDTIYWSGVVTRLPIKQTTITETIPNAAFQLTTNIFTFEGGSPSVENFDNKQNCAKFVDKFFDEFRKFSINLTFDGARVLAKSELSSGFWQVSFSKNSTLNDITNQGVEFSRNIEILEPLNTEKNRDLCDIFSWNIYFTDLDDFGIEITINSQVFSQDTIWAYDSQIVNIERTIDLTLKSWKEKYFNFLSRIGILITLSSKKNDYFYDIINISTDYPNVELEFSVRVGTTANYYILNSKQSFVRVGPQFSMVLNSREFSVGSVQSSQEWDVSSTIDNFLDTWSDYFNQLGVYFNRFGPQTLEIFQKNQRDIRTLEFKTYLNTLPGESVVEKTDNISGKLGNLITSNSIVLTNVSATNSFTPSSFSLNTWDVSYNAYTQSGLESFENFSLAEFSTGMVVGLVNTNYIYNNQEYNLIYVSNYLMSLSYQGPFWGSVCIGDVSKIITYPDGTTYSFCRIEENVIGSDFSQISVTSSFYNATFSRVTDYSFFTSEIPEGILDIVYQKYSKKYYLLSDTLFSYHSKNKELIKNIFLPSSLGSNKFLRVSDWDGSLWVVSQTKTWKVNSFFDEIVQDISIQNPYDLFIDPQSGRVYSTLTYETDLKIYDPNLSLLRNYQLDSFGRKFSYDRINKTLWVTAQSGTIYQLDTDSMNITSTYSVPGLSEDIFYHPVRKSFIGGGTNGFFEFSGGSFSIFNSFGITPFSKIYFSYQRDIESLDIFDSSGNLSNYDSNLSIDWARNFVRNGPISTNSLDTNIYTSVFNKCLVIDRNSGSIRTSVTRPGDVIKNIYNPERRSVLFLSPQTGELIEIAVRVTILESKTQQELEKLVGNYFGTLDYDYVPEDIFWLHVREFVRKPREYYSFQKSNNTELYYKFEDVENKDYFLFDFSGDQLPEDGQLSYQGVKPLDVVVLNKTPNRDPQKINDAKYQQTIFDKISWKLSYVDNPLDMNFETSSLELFVGFNSKTEGVSKNNLLLIKREPALWETIPNDTNFDFISLKLDQDPVTGNSIGRIILDPSSNSNFLEDENGIIRGFWNGQIIQINLSDVTNFNGQYISYNNGLKLRIKEVYFREIVVEFVEDDFMPEQNVIYNFPSEGRTTFLKTTIKSFDRVIARFQFQAQTNIEDTRLGVEISNTGKNISPEVSWIFKDYDINEQGIDWNFLNPKRKEYLLIRDDIFHYVGSYRSLINAINFFGYNDLTLNEYYRNIDENSPKFNKLFKVEIPDIFNTSVKGWSDKDFIKFSLPNPRYTGTKLFNLAYKITDKQGNNVIHYSVREALVKLHGLKKWLERNVVPITHKILDITGEAYTLGTSHISHRNYDIKVIKITDGFSPVDFSINEAYLLPITSGSYVFNVAVDFSLQKGTLESPFSLEIRTYKTFLEWEPFKNYMIGDKVRYYDYLYESRINNNKINNPRKYENVSQWQQTVNYQPGEIVKWKDLVYIFSATQSSFEYTPDIGNPVEDPSKWLDITIWKKSPLEPVQSYSEYKDTLDTFNFTLDTSIDPFITVKVISENGRGGYFVKKKNYEIRWIDNRALPVLFLADDRLPDRNIYTTTTTSTTTICPENCISFTFCEDAQDMSWFFCKDDDFAFTICPSDDFSYCIDDFTFQIGGIQPTTTSTTTTSTTTLPTTTTTTTSTTTILVPTTGFRSVWNITSPGQTITLPLIPSGIYNFDINWGDGISQTVATYSSRTHTYSSVGTYSISITGQIEGWSFQGVTFSRDNILSVLSWGSLKIGNQGGAFFVCQNLTLDSVTDILDLSGVTNLSNTFGFGISIDFIQNIELWDVSNVTNMSDVFVRCQSFNQSLNDWDVSNVTNMSGMFWDCTSFDQLLNDWDVSSVSDMQGMFFGCVSFDQPLNDWDVSNVTNMGLMFGECTSFNQPLNDWDVSNVTNMSLMFADCSLFNQPLNNWDVCNVSNMQSMFNSCLNYDQDISSWKVPLIPAKPTGFDTNTLGTWTTQEKPQWGVSC